MNAPVDIRGVELRTARLLLRPWRPDDLEDFHTYARVDGVGQMAGWLPHKDREETQKILDLFISQHKTFALEWQGRVVGSLGIEPYDEENYPELAPYQGRELGYVLAKPCWGQGLMPEAVKEVIHYLFELKKLDFLIAGHFERNTRSGRVIEKCGFRPYKVLPYQTQYGTVETSLESILWNPSRPGTV